MKRIDLVKYGFVRSPEDDFSDDGNRFTCYRVGSKVRVSKLVSDGEAYLSGSISDSDLPYEIYSKLPHYSEAEWKYNGVSLSALTEADLQNLYDACVAYEKEWDEAIAGLVLPEAVELNDAAFDLERHRQNEFHNVQLVLSQNLEKLFALQDYQYRRVREYYNRLKEEAEAPVVWQEFVGKPYSIQLLARLQEQANKHSFYYEELMKMIGG